MLRAEEVKKDFPIFASHPGLVYLDNAATTQKPRAVIEALVRYYSTANANVHRAAYPLAERATEMFEEARRRVARFIGAEDPAEVVFTRNATEAINLVAYAWARRNLRPGDRVAVTLMEHHANLVPWQEICRERGAELEFIGLTPEGHLNLEEFEEILSRGVRILALTQASNVLGTINPVAELSARARRAGALVLVDGAQSVPHMRVDVRELGADFFAFSGHKMLGPTGIGVLWGRRELLEEMEPFLYGGEMISRVTLERATWNELPHRFEAGTPHVAGAVGLAAAVDYLEALGMTRVHRHEQWLVDYARQRLEETGVVEIYGPVRPRAGLLSFNLRGVHPHDVASILGEEGVAIRAGHHCAQPLMDWLGVPATCRASFYVYNSLEDVDRLVEALMKVREFFRHAVG